MKLAIMSIMMIPNSCGQNNLSILLPSLTESYLQEVDLRECCLIINSYQLNSSAFHSLNV